MSFRIIGLTGHAGAGKDTAADHLCRRYNFARHAFAKPIKDALNAMMGWVAWQWDNREWKERVQLDIGKSPRQMAQTLGTEWGRNQVNRDLWLLLATREIEWAKQARYDGIVFTDCRFENEALFVRNANGHVLSIRRPDTGVVSEHVSEKPLPAWLVSRFILNDATVPDLYERIDDFMVAQR